MLHKIAQPFRGHASKTRFQTAAPLYGFYTGDGPVALAAAAAMVFILFIYWPAATGPALPRTRLQQHPISGPAGAPVQIGLYGDFADPNCRRWHLDGAQAALQQRYGGQVAFVWHDLPGYSLASPRAAQAGQCAFDQGKFWPFHDALFTLVSDAPDDAALLAAARTARLDPARFSACLQSGRYAALVKTGVLQARAVSVRAAPALTINGQLFDAAPTLENLSWAVEQALAGPAN